MSRLLHATAWLCIILGAPVWSASVALSADRADEGGVQAPTSLTDPDRALLREAIEASGLAPDATFEERLTHLEEAIESILRHMGEGEPTRRRARRLHRHLHDRWLGEYTRRADGLHRIVEAGRFNCVSAALLEGWIAERLGFDVELVEHPRHVRLRYWFDGKPVLVEPTDAYGFDLRADPQAGGFRPEPRHLQATGTVEAPRVEANTLPVAAALGLVWLNTAWRTLETGDGLAAARAAQRAAGHIPNFRDLDGVPLLLSRSFGAEYEPGRFERAWRVATIDVGLYPGRTTARDRLLAVTQKRIEDACDLGDIALAERLIDHARAAIGQVGDPTTDAAAPGARDVQRFERRTRPLIVAAAVRIGDRAAATRSLAAYAAAEPDAVEVGRLAGWMAARLPGDAVSQHRNP